MEEINIGEQPPVEEVHTVATDFSSGTEKGGSPLGKFKSAEALLGAYNELQSEFTRKCQKLSDAEKKLQDAIPAGTSRAEVSDGEFAWDKNISEFLQSHKYAKDFVEDITNEIINKKDLKSDGAGLEKAYYRVLESKYLPAEELAKNGEFLEKYIYSNKEIKDKIIAEYVSQLKSNQNPIKVSSVSSPGVATRTQFTSLEDARKYVENMFRF